MSAFPPHRSTDALPVSQEVALQFLSTYLTASKTSPHLLPNARLEPSGPTSGSSNSSVTIHNLQRVEAGLRGEWLAPVLEINEPIKVTEGMDDGTNTGAAAAEAESEGWMDLDQYQREQSIEGVEAGSPGAGVVPGDGDSDLEGNHSRVNEKDIGDGAGAPAANQVKLTQQAAPKKAIVDEPKDKLARKKAKKDRLKAEKIEREKARQTATN